MNGLLLAIHISPNAGSNLRPVTNIRAIAGRGLEGDRYALGCGTFSGNPQARDVTLIEHEALEQFCRDYGCELDPALSRRNLLTRGVRLNELVGRDFVIGKVPMRGLRLCEPCAHLARLTSMPVLPGLIRRGGLYAQILRDGELAVGDAIQTEFVENTFVPLPAEQGPVNA